MKNLQNVLNKKFLITGVLKKEETLEEKLGLSTCRSSELGRHYCLELKIRDLQKRLWKLKEISPETQIKILDGAEAKTDIEKTNFFNNSFVGTFKKKHRQNGSTDTKWKQQFAYWAAVSQKTAHFTNK